MLKHIAYKFRMYPNNNQKEMLSKTFGSKRKVYNYFLSLWEKTYEDTKVGLSYKECSAMLPALKNDPEYFYLKEIDSIALQSALFDLSDAYKRLFTKQNKRPKYKSKLDSVQSYRTKNTNNNLYIKGNYIKLPKIGYIKLRNSFNFSDKIINATITKSSSNKYYVSVLAEKTITPLPLSNSKIGIDLGLRDYLVLSDGTKIKSLDIPKELIDKLIREKRKLSRRGKQVLDNGIKLIDAKNYQKQKVVVAKIYEKIRNISNDFTNKLSTNIIKNHDVISIESLNVKGMLKNSFIAKEISSAALSNFVRMLEYKADYYGKTLVKVNTYYPSTQICSSCKTVTGKKALRIRSWTCPVCGEIHDRDINASINILNEGLRILATK